MPKLDIQFLWGIESAVHKTSLGGSCQLYTLTYKEQIFQVLVDIGSFVGMDPKLSPNQLEYIDMTKLKAIVLTHVHNDHVGRLAELVKSMNKQGYNIPIYMTSLSQKLLTPILEDTLKIQRSSIEEVRKYNKRLGTRLQRAHSTIRSPKKLDKITPETLSWYQKLLDKYDIKKNADIAKVLKALPPEPTFSEHDILQTIWQTRTQEYGESFDLVPGLWDATLYNAGHVEWAAQILMRMNWKPYKPEKYRYTLLNTWDLGRLKEPYLLYPPTRPRQKENIDMTIMEWTYGWRMHANRKDDIDKFVHSIQWAQDRFVVPAFSLQRFQQLMHLLWKAKKEKKLKLQKNEKIYCVSPLAYEFVKTFMAEDSEKYAFLADDMFYRVESKEDQAKVKSEKWRRIVIAWWWMWQGWSSVRYIQYALQNPNSHIRFTWYQAQGTLGKELLDKYQTGQKVRIGEKDFPIRSTINQLKSFSSHADESELVGYIDSLDKRAHHHTIITHGWEQRFDLKQALQNTIEKGTYTVPELFDTVSIDTVSKKIEHKNPS